MLKLKPSQWDIRFAIRIQKKCKTAYLEIKHYLLRHFGLNDATDIMKVIIGIIVMVFLTQYLFYNSTGPTTMSDQNILNTSNNKQQTTTKSLESSDQSEARCDIVSAFNNMPNDLKKLMKANDNKFMNGAMPQIHKYFENELICEPVYPLPAFELLKPPSIDLNCADPRYELVLNGELAQETKYIVDLLIFGFDVDYLEIRLYENYDIVDAFYVLEQNITLRGYKKQFLLPQVLNTSRFLPFADKIHYIQDHVGNEWMKKHLHGGGKIANFFGTTGMRGRQMVKQYFLDDFAEKDIPLNNVYVLQNDGDEIINRAALHHFKHCKDKNEFPVYAPGLIFKQNVYIAERNGGMRGIKHWPEKYSDIKPYLWWIGPHIWKADLVTNESFSIRKEAKKFDSDSHHLGYGAANHFSNPGHPILHYIKIFSTEDQAPIALGNSFWTHLENGNLTLEMIEYELFQCKANLPFALLETVLNKESQAMIQDNLPWIVKKFPQRYPFLTAFDRQKQQKKWFEEKCPIKST